ncbi:ABC transporter-like protein [Acephala macrosclerotiorum]|nr:ABC transporter-like protein [Acephala macrosclerotiorum]
MRRATVFRGHRLGAAVCDLACQQLSRTTPVLAATQLQPSATLHTTRRVSSSFNARPIPSPSAFKPVPQPLTSKLLGHSNLGLSSPWRPAIAQLRPFNSTSHLRDTPKESDRQDLIEKEKARREEEEEDLLDEQPGFERSEKASKAAQVNLSARLSSPKAQGNTAGFGEIWRLIKIARPEAKWLGLAFAFLLISSTITMSIPFSIGKILDLATKDPSEGSTLFGLDIGQFYIALGCVLTLGAAANYGRIIILRIVGERIVSRLRSQLYRRTYVQNAEFFDANRVGDLISRLSSDTVIVGKSITQNLSDGLRAIVSGAAGFTAMAWVSLKLTSILCLMFPPVAIGAFFYGRAIRNLSRKIQRNLGTLTKIAEERLGNVRTSQAFAGEIQEVGRYNHQVKKIFSLGKREAIISATFFSSSGFLGNMTILALLYSGGSMVKSGVISIGDLTSFLMYTAYAGSSLFGVSSFYSELMKGVGAASRLFELQDRKPTIPATIGTKVKSAQGPIKFSNVSFAYPTRPAVNIFDGLDFEIPSGTNVAIVGPSGGGKSTIGSLLLRFYNPTEGSIQINGIDISTMNGKSLRRRIGMVGQEPVLFSGSIAENIAYGKPQATRSEIIAAARKANCQFISDFPEGLDTQVGARGAQLSGGQKQRIAIARALLKNPDILILDEATSALDAESETLVNSALAALLRGHNTTISIAHRLSTIKRSDHIIVLGNDGKVAETGTYNALSANPDSAFSKLMEWQMSGGDAADKRSMEPEGHLTETEEIADDLVRLSEEDAGEEEIDEEGAKERDEKETKS